MAYIAMLMIPWMLTSHLSRLHLVIHLRHDAMPETNKWGYPNRWVDSSLDWHNHYLHTLLAVTIVASSSLFRLLFPVKPKRWIFRFTSAVCNKWTILSSKERANFSCILQIEKEQITQYWILMLTPPFFYVSLYQTRKARSIWEIMYAGRM